MNKKLYFLIVVFAIFIIINLLLVDYMIFGNGKNADKEKMFIVFSIGSGDVGGTFFPVASTISQIINENTSRIKALVKATSGSVDNARMVGTGELLFGMCMGDIAFDALQGKNEFNKEYPNLRCLFATYPSVSQWITLQDSGIRSLEDLKGKNVAVGMYGSGSEVASSIILDAIGIDYPDGVKARYLGAGEGAVAVREGNSVASHTIGGIPFGAYYSLSGERNIEIIPIEKEIVEKIKAKYPYYFSATIPQYSYKGQTQAIRSIGVKCLFICNAKSVSDELAYSITKAVWEHKQEMYSGHSSLEAMKENFVASELPIPLHPGAEKYWKEIGLLK